MPPTFQIVSDRRGMTPIDTPFPLGLCPLTRRNPGVVGGRTAWSSQVTIQGQTLAARYWYDGKNLNNAKEDAAECALNWLRTAW